MHRHTGSQGDYYSGTGPESPGSKSFFSIRTFHFSWEQPGSFKVKNLARTVRLWALSDTHVGTEIKFGRRSLEEAIRQAEAWPAEPGTPDDSRGFDIAVNLGDFSGSQLPPDDEEGELVVAQYATAKNHGREHFYDVIGNHDASGADEPTQWWFKKWIDPTGESTEFSGIDNTKRPYPTSGTWEHYSFEVGNILFLMLADRNDGGPPIGRGEFGGYPAGAISEETFEWWTEKVRGNTHKIVITAHHHMIKETTVASGLNEGCDGGYHGRMPDGGAPGASLIYWVGGQKDSGRIENFLAENTPAIDLWLGAHTHTHPDDTTGGRSHIEQKWGANFVNVSAITRYHGQRNSIPMSRLFTFAEGSDEVRVQCYLHTDQYAPEGWHKQSERTLKLRHKFEVPTAHSD